MTVVVVTSPAQPVIERALVKAHLRVDHDDDDTLIDAYLAAATGHIDGPEGWLGRCLGQQTLELTLHGDAWPRCGATLALPCGPILSVDSVTYIDPAGAEQTIGPGSGIYTLLAGGLLALAYGQSWPATRSQADGIVITYTAGYAVLPKAIEAAILLMTGDLYANRETVVTGVTAAAVPMSATVSNLLSPFRAWRE